MSKLTTLLTAALAMSTTGLMPMSPYPSRKNVSNTSNDPGRSKVLKRRATEKANKRRGRGK